MTSSPDQVDVVSTFTVASESRQELVDLLLRNVDAVLSAAPGFQGCDILVGEDATTVLSHTRWRDLDALRAMLARPDARAHAAQIRQLATVHPARFRLATPGGSSAAP